MASNKTPESPDVFDSSKKSTIRRPYPATDQRLRNGDFDTSQSTPGVTTSKLSVNAAEFIPKCAQVVSQNEESPEAFYQDFQRITTIRPLHLGDSSNASVNSAANIFKEAVFKLTSNPGPMEEYLKPIVNMLTPGRDIDEIIETLFEQSIIESNFRYTGAKVCKYLTNELKSNHVCEGFRNQFLKRCQLEFDRRDELLQTNLERLCGLSMFFGELFLVLEIDQNGVTTKVAILRKSIGDLLRTILTQIGDETVKCATQLLKLTGTALMETTDLSEPFDDIFEKIRSLEKAVYLNKTSHCLINSVLSRIDNNFGVDQQVSPQKPVDQAQLQNSANFQNEPTFYNTDGQPITREEAGFLGDENELEGLNIDEQEAFFQWEAENYENFANQQCVGEPGLDMYVNGPGCIGDSNPFIEQYSSVPAGYTHWSTNQDQEYAYNGTDYYPDYGNEMDEEMAAAYEMFLQESGQNNSQ